jgi:hypothetical protein
MKKTEVEKRLGRDSIQDRQQKNGGNSDSTATSESHEKDRTVQIQNASKAKKG